ncbi:DUF4238 domain-containing protein [Vibrio antiquarius]|uniref:DUF4238 domain-containing protein n=1 Tax=Vibrio antiquarius (strain Ex25) TaxID=150340 RepID=UPI0009409B13|nr:DUF4238 domain-containing protein [Vibrio antiquarius]
MSEKQNQHYVPQYYLRNFSNDGISIRMLLKKQGKVIKNVTIDNQASDNNFYGDHEIEKKVTTYDNQFSAVISKAILGIKNNSLSGEDFLGLFKAVCFQYLRTSAQRHNKKPLMDFYEDFYQEDLKNVDDYDSGVSQEATDAVNFAMRSVLEAMSDGKKWQLFDMFNLDYELSEISDLDAVFIINKTKFPLVCSDSPVNRFNIALQDLECDKVGNKNHGLIIYYPISSEFGFLLFDKNAYKLKSDDLNIVTITNESDVYCLNSAQLYNSVNSVFFKDFQFSEYVKNMWEDNSENLEVREAEIVYAEEVTLDGYLTGRTVRVLAEPKNKFVAKLSFLSAHSLEKFRCIPLRERFVSFCDGSVPYFGKIEMAIDKKLT